MIEAHISLVDPCEIKGFIPIDASWFLPTSSRNAHQEYLQKRIPGARFFDLEKCSRDSIYPHMLPEPKQFSETMHQLGIQNSDHIVIYDSLGMFSSPRVWFTFKYFGHENVHLLNGGLSAYIESNLPLESSTTDPSFKVSDYPIPTPNTNWIADYQDVMKVAVGQSESIIIDARPHERWSGVSPEPRPGIPSGHIPHSISVPFSKLLINGKYRNKQDLMQVFANSNVDMNRTLITSCGSGISACVDLVGLLLVGKKDVKLYDESWTGYVHPTRAGGNPELIQK
ncbi:thiosulfate MPST [Acrasis kona]|uniref:Thiosulfate MPST n=1 Tax=Acrasis kona TaxID=1008807 RepID=A0AAW2Z2L7_9EUKA